MPSLPSGTVTFLFSDMEGSTALLKRLGDERFGELLVDHRRILRDVFADRGGQEIDTQGDALFYSFPRARDAVAAAVQSQRSLARHEWPDGLGVRVRMGLHTGEPAVGSEGYTGLDVVRAARIAAVGRGGQVLLSETTRALIGEDLPEGVSARSIGAQRLKDIDRPEPLHELIVEGVSASPAREVEVPKEEAPASSSEFARRYEQLAERARLSIERRVLSELEQALGNLGGGTPPPIEEP
jgi:class 3 adenylate cyclase